MSLTVSASGITFDDLTTLSTASISASNLARNSVGTLQLSAGAVTTDKIALGAVIAEDIANGAITRPKMGYPGAILQVVQAVKTDTYPSSSTSWIDIPGLSVSITPTSSTSKILVMCTGMAGSAGANSGALKLVRNTTDIFTGNAASGYVPVTWANFYGGSNDGNNSEGFSITYLDSPNTTSSTTYKLQLITQGAQIVINANGADVSGQNYSYRGASSITLMEVAG